MRKFWALLLTLAMVMQLVALPTAVAEEVTTPTDLKLPCEACGGYAVLAWTMDSDGTHVKACPHGVKDEEGRHIWGGLIYEGDESKHWRICRECGLTTEKKDHYDICTNPGVCVLCEKTGVTIQSTTHDYDFENRQYDQNECWYVCKNCGIETDRHIHMDQCSNPGVCFACKQSGVTCSDTLHQFGEYQYTDTECWQECQDCGKKSVVQKHFDNCKNPGVCLACGQSGVTITSSIHEDKENRQYNQDECWYECKNCGQKRDISRHHDSCANPGVCLACGQSGVTIFSSIHQVNTENRQYNQEQCWFVCTKCGAKENVNDHRDRCTNPGVCMYCGQSNVTLKPIFHQFDYRSYKNDSTGHWRVCLDCAAQGEKWNHTGDCSNPDVCEECGQSGVELAYVRHNYDMEHYDYDQYSHWTTCANCGNKQRGLHTSDCLNPDVCWQCGQTGVTMDYVEHIWSPSGSVTWEYDNKEHWLTCVCGEEDAREEHYNLCTDLNTCDGCGATGVEFTSTIHDWNEIAVEYDNEKCWKICRACGEKFGEEYHVALCTMPNVCFYCDKVGVTISEIGHNLVPDFSAYEHDGEKHWQTCPDCGELYEEEHWPSVEDSTKCSICGGTIQTETPSPIPSEKPSAEPTVSPTEKPTQSPTASPIPLPTEQVTATPTAKPTEQVTATPTAKPTEQATTAPTAKPTEQATTEPTAKPTEQVTTEPTVEPTEQPTSEPTKKPAPVPTEAPAHEHTFDIAFISNNDGTHSKACLGNCGEVLTENCHLVTTDMGLMTCTACATCGYAVYTAKEGVAALTEGETVPAKVVRVETAAIAPAAEDAPEAVPADTQLLVHETTFDVPVALSTELKGTVEKVFTATLVKDGETIQPTGKVKLTIPVEEETLAALEGKVLMLMREDGTLIELEYEIIDGEIVFLTDELGVFLLMIPEAK